MAELHLYPTAAHDGCGDTWPNPPRSETHKEVIARLKVTDVHTGFGLEAKNVDLVIRDESQMCSSYKKEN